MNKLPALISNELTKIFKKVSILVIIAITLFGIIIMSLGTSAVFSSVTQEYEYDSTDYYNEQIEELKAESDALMKLASESEDEDELSELNYRIDQINCEIRKCELYIESGMANSETNRELPQFYGSLIDTLATVERNPNNAGFRITEKRRELLTKAYENKDYSKWIEFQKDILPEIYTETEIYRIHLDELNLKLKADPEGKGNFEGEINTITDYRTTLVEKYGAPLSAAQRTEYENKIAALTYRVENRISYDSEGLTSIKVIDGFGTFMVTLLVIILAGGSISSELSTGSIKSLIIAPVRRWKIYAAKLISLIVIGLASTVGLYLFNSLITALFFGKESFVPYVFASAGKISVISAPLYRLFSALLGYVDIMVFTFFAFTLSVITRNTAVSVGLSMAIYFGGSLVTGLLGLLSDSTLNRIISFMPSSNLSLATRVFPDASEDIISELIMGISNQNSVTFSVCYITVISVCMLLSAYDSFTKRDI